MVQQRPLDLSQPLDQNASPKLEKVPLTPELIESALVLHGDYYGQSQSRLNRFLFWHPVSLTIYSIVFPIALAYGLWDYITISDSIGEFFYYFARSTDPFFEILGVLPAIVITLGIIGLISYLISDDIKTVSDELPKQEYAKQIFGFDIKLFSWLDPTVNKEKSDIELLALGNNTQFIIYRESPIAVCTINPDYENSTEKEFIVRLTGLHIRKVFQKVDFDDLLLDWAIIRSRELFKPFSKKLKIKNIEESKITITTKAYTFNKQQIDILLKKDFVEVDSTIDLNPFVKSKYSSIQKAVYKYLNIGIKTFAFSFIPKSEDEDLLIKLGQDAVLNDAEVVGKESNKKSLRKRH
ncbi:inorganic phosphate transporter Pho86 [Scheffersomyces amazonensis]|uniref:inorganic phosphate transporter Pho86 n=1 Tax=Scheffersomyces amazonensis TaxID=1078765 RepID=UPI00315CC922